MTTITTHPTPIDEAKRLTATTSFASAGDTDWVKMFGELAVQITGNATAVTATVERSTDDPTGTANPAPAGDAITGDPATGIKAVGYFEPGAAWWRVSVSAVSGGTAEVAISGQGWHL